MTEKFDRFISDLTKQFGKREVKKGMKTEKEHDDVTKGDRKRTAKIVRAHLKERPDYYDKLEQCVEN